MAIITDAELASYLEVSVTPSLTLKVQLANDLVEGLPYATPLPSPVPARVRAITFEVAARAVRNANGYSSETIDDYTYRRDPATRSAGVYLTADEHAELLGFGGSSDRGAYTVSLWG